MTDKNRNHGYQSPPIDSGEVDLREILRVLWAGKWLIAGIALAATIIAVIVVLILPNIYRAEALLAPRKSEGASGLAGLAAEYGGLASMVGIDLEGKSSDGIDEGLEILVSRKFITNFIEQHDILAPLMAAKGWDRETGELEIDSDIYDVPSGEWVRNVRPPKQTIPSALEAYDLFIDEVFSVSRNPETGFVTIAVQHYSPDVARQWVDWLVTDINATIMRRDIEEAEQAIDFLNRQIEATSLADLRNVFFRLIEEQTKTVMLAKMSDEYLLKTLDPAVAPEEKAKPKRAIIVTLSTIVSGVLAMFLVLLMGSRTTDH